MKSGTAHTLVSAYSALATVALGLVGFGVMSERNASKSNRVAVREASTSVAARIVAFVTRQASGDRPSAVIK